MGNDKDKGSNNGVKIAIGAVAGVVAGFVTGILTAPKSGKETRQDIKDTANKVTREAEKKLKELHQELNDLVKAAKTKLGTLKESSQGELKKALEAAEKAREKAKSLLSAIHEGGSDNEELDAAIKEVTSAVKHLKKYLS